MRTYTHTHTNNAMEYISHTRTRTDVCGPRLHNCNATRPCLTAKISITIGWRSTTHSTNKRKVKLASSGMKGGAMGLTTPPIDPYLDIHMSSRALKHNFAELSFYDVATSPANHAITQGRTDSRLLRTRHVQQYRRRSASRRPLLQRPRSVHASSKTHQIKQRLVA